MTEQYQVVGIWISAFLTLCIFSFLYKDNPFYKFAEHVFIGVSAGYWMVLGYWNVLKPNLIDQILTGKLIFVIPAVLGVLLLLRLVPSISWVSRWPICFMVGITAGFQIVYTMEAQVLDQVHATILPLWVDGNFARTLANWILVFGVLTGLIYFYFSVEHRGPVFGVSARIGIWVLMIAFGAAFGYTVMARVSLLIGRVLFFRDDWWPTITWL
ncbi:MAG: hypothetical protein AB1758_04325 [Candidatus Eremiobacterota bacterium]